ncbi:MAG: tRNA (N(6)-L-threonylcarbamoyladenosine(37)-C(2))-methylthiotransferase MtaB [Bacteroidales bacterium]|nr:tRNA (N(6)-L-threonylcarbamoyladenosine(37)-C(2))-methylthiotransferase MtaB [Bacteroidales bacterium]
MNFAESSAISQKFIQKGYRLVDFTSTANIYVIHSCMVTQQAERKCIASIRQAQKKNPAACVAVIGCMAELKKERLSKEGTNLLLLGNNSKYDIVDILENKKIFQRNTAETFVPSWSHEGRTRIFFKVQDGCDYFCSYCTIPLARGRSRSATVESTIKNIQDATSGKCNELVLTGINLGDFGRKNSETLLDLLTEIEKFKNIKRIRLSSIEPDLVNDQVIEFILSHPQFMPHFHIPLQSGSDKILKLMKRNYNTGLFAARVEKIKKLIPHACVATDIITGFPGETETEHQETVDFINKTDISYIHVFTYSSRPDTKAEKATQQVGEKIKKMRSRELHQISDDKKNKFYNENIGRECDALFESKIYKGFVLGYTDNYIRVKAKFSEDILNSIRTIKIKSIDNEGICHVDFPESENY